MRKISQYSRMKRLIQDAVNAFSLDLTGISVLTEAASGPFAVTPLIAAMANAENVVAVSRSSSYGSFADVNAYLMELADYLGVRHLIKVTEQNPIAYAARAQLVTNLGFVRPISREFIMKLPENAAISLMWEPWEFRSEDVDLQACEEFSVPILGTNESDERLQTFRYIGYVAMKLLFELELEVFRSRILVIGSGPFGKETCAVLSFAQADVLHYVPGQIMADDQRERLRSFIEGCDAIVLVEHYYRKEVIGGESGLPLSWFDDVDVPLAHICGNFDPKLLNMGLVKHPTRKVDPGFMTVTTDYVGMRPVIDLHAAGLKVGQEMFRGMKKYGNVKEAEGYALASGLALAFD